jgi:hypothetical protein
MQASWGKKLSATVALTLLSLLIVSGAARATNISKASYGITVGPAGQQVSLSQGQDSLTFNTGIANNTNTSVVVELSALDFTGLNNSGAISFLTSARQDKSNTHSLASSLSYVLPEFALAPGQTETVPVTINNANLLSVGGHYAAIIFKVKNAPVLGVKNTVNVNEEVSSLVFVSTEGLGTQSVVLQYASLGSHFTHFPKNVNVILADPGNTQTVPTGVIQIVNSKGTIITQTQINTSANLILPEVNRLFNFKLTSYKAQPTTGYYTFKFYYKTASQTRYNLYQKRFLYIAPQVLYLSIAIVVLLIILLVQRLPRLSGYKSKHKKFNS